MGLEDRRFCIVELGGAAPRKHHVRAFAGQRQCGLVA
jgi:hypothetical protein